VNRVTFPERLKTRKRVRRHRYEARVKKQSVLFGAIHTIVEHDALIKGGLLADAISIAANGEKGRADQREETSPSHAAY